MLFILQKGADDMAHKAADKTANVWEKTKEAAHEAKEGARKNFPCFRLSKR